MRLLEHPPAVSRRIASLGAARFAARLQKRDASLWSGAPGRGRARPVRLGWLAAPARMLGEVPGLREFARQARTEKIRHAVLLGTKAAAADARLFRDLIGRRPDAPELIVLDPDDDRTVRKAEARCEPARTLVLVVSKGEPDAGLRALLDRFWSRFRRDRGRRAGRQFAAITDPGTSLSESAAARGFRATFHDSDEIGETFATLSFRGMVPAALLGIDIENVLKGAVGALRLCGAAALPPENPGLVLGAALGELALRGRDEIDLRAEAPLAPLAIWIGHLLAAESRGALRPLVWAPRGGVKARAAGGPRRVVVRLALRGGAAAARLEKIVTAPAGAAPAGTPVIALVLRDRLDVGTAVVQWQVALAAAASILGRSPTAGPTADPAGRRAGAVV